MCLILSPPKQDLQHINEAPRPARRKTRASTKSTSRYDDEHIIGSRSTDDRVRYTYGPKGDITGVRVDDSYVADLSDPGLRFPRASVSSTSRYDDEHIISAPSRPHLNPRVSTRLGMAQSVSQGDDEHIIAARRRDPRDTYVYGSDGQILGLRGEDGRPYATEVVQQGCAGSISRYDDEHVISTKSVGGASSGRQGGGLFGMFSGESSHGNDRDGGRRIGEKLIGSAYGPGRFLGGRSTLRVKREAEKGSARARPKEYGI